MADVLKVPKGLISDVEFRIFKEDIKSSSGVALDIGSTIAKLIYRSNKTYKDAKPIQAQDDASKGVLRFAMFPRTDIPGFIQYIKDHADLTANEEGEIIINSSGIGGAAFRKELEEGLNCKLEIISEFECFVKAFLAMEKALSKEELLIPDNPDVAIYAEEIRKKFEPVMQKLHEMSSLKPNVDEANAAMKEEERPRVLVMAGSGTAIMQVNTDGSNSILSGIFTGGRFMYGLASILSGENDWPTLMELAKKGDGKSTDIWSDDLFGEADRSSGKSVYEMAETNIDMCLFPFGKGISTRREDMKKEDLVFSTFMSTALTHCQTLNSDVKACKAKHVYFAGNLFNSELMRTAISKKKHDVTAFESPNFSYEFHFLRNGGMFGALGALLNKKSPE